METERPVERGTGQHTEALVIREKSRKEKRKSKDDLTTRLNHLRTEAKQVCESYLANLDGDVSALVDFLNGTSEVQKDGETKAKAMKAWRKTLDRLTVKPAKGRKKDLRRIDDAVRSMMRTAFE